MFSIICAGSIALSINIGTSMEITNISSTENSRLNYGQNMAVPDNYFADSREVESDYSQDADRQRDEHRLRDEYRESDRHDESDRRENRIHRDAEQRRRELESDRHDDEYDDERDRREDYEERDSIPFIDIFGR